MLYARKKEKRSNIKHPKKEDVKQRFLHPSKITFSYKGHGQTII